MTSETRIATCCIYAVLVLAPFLVYIWVPRASQRFRRLGGAGMYLSAAVFMASIVSFWWDFGYAGSAWEIRALDGEVALVITHEPGRYIYSKGWFWKANPTHNAPDTFFRIVYAAFPRLDFNKRYNVVSIPTAALAIGVALLSFVAWHRARRHPIGHCQECDYDLTGNVSGVCPECGAEIPEEQRKEVGELPAQVGEG